MKNSDLAKKVRELRIRKGFSQDELAENSQLSLRTIQRIENGETEPRGDTLKRLANALNVNPEELISWSEQEDQGYLAFLNLSALSFIVFPLLGVILPFALWVLKKDKIRYISEVGKKLINFQITWSVVVFVFYILVLVPKLLHQNIFNIQNHTTFIIFAIYSFYIFNAVLITINTIRSIKAKNVIYQPAIPFLK
jgi:transcriptional regulator with XRE-family HTH domain